MSTWRALPPGSENGFLLTDDRPLIQPIVRTDDGCILTFRTSGPHVLSLLASRPMAQLIVRKLDANLVRALKSRAARNGRSTEAEHRAILESVLGSGPSRPSFKEWLQRMPDAGDDADFARVAGRPRKVKL